MKEKYCSKCGNKFEGKEENICLNCKRKKGTDNYCTIGIIVMFLGIIGSIILFVSSTNSDMAINMFLYCIAGTIILSIPFFAVHSICHRLDVIADKLDSNK